MRACLAKLAILGALLLGTVASVLGQEQFPGTSYITPFPVGDVYHMQVYGDAFAEGLLGGLVEAMGDETRLQLQLQRRRRPLAGIMRPELDDELKTEEASADTVHIAVVMLGYNDRYNFYNPNPRTGLRERIEVGSAEWRAEYGRRVDRFVKTLKKRGAAVYWVGLPVMRRPEMNEPAQAVNDVVREKAYLNGIKYIDIGAHFSDEAGNYTPYGPDIAGQQRLVREPDGVLFTAAGNRKLAYFVEREIKRDLTQARSERSIPLAGAEAEQKRIAALRPHPAEPDAGPKGSVNPGKDAAGKGPAKGAPKPATLAPASAVPSPDASGEAKADNGRISLGTVGTGGREETVTVELPRPSIAAAVLQLITRRDTGDRPSQMGDTLADDVGGGLVVLSSVTPMGGPGAPRKAMPGQPYYQVWFKGERLTPRPGRSDDFSWPRADVDVPVEPPRAPPTAPAAPAKASPRT
ncbi:MAG: DUF459 domain-containing protein [Hyphomicrobiaceae bacterium]|nr:DUF459 domain-containing protein [Hyphomicrobiaceae bacterium]